MHSTASVASLLLLAPRAAAYVLASSCSASALARHPEPACGIFDLVMPGGGGGYSDPLDQKGLEMYGGKMTSRVWYSAPKPDEWSKLLLILPHEAVRHELLRLERISPKLQYRQSGDPTLEALDEYYGTYVQPAISHMHKMEDEVLFPAIREALLEVPSEVSQRLTVAATAFREPQAWSDDDLKAVCTAIASGNGLLVSKSFGTLSDRCGNLMEQKERVLAGLLGENLDPEWCDGYKAKLDAWSAEQSFSETFGVMIQTAASASALSNGLKTTIADEAVAAVNKPKVALLQRCIGNE